MKTWFGASLSPSENSGMKWVKLKPIGSVRSEVSTSWVRKLSALQASEITPNRTNNANVLFKCLDWQYTPRAPFRIIKPPARFSTNAAIFKRVNVGDNHRRFYLLRMPFLINTVSCNNLLILYNSPLFMSSRKYSNNQS